jgi:hypothetical protein
MGSVIGEGRVQPYHTIGAMAVRIFLGKAKSNVHIHSISVTVGSGKLPEILIQNGDLTLNLGVRDVFCSPFVDNVHDHGNGLH